MAKNVPGAAIQYKHRVFFKLFHKFIFIYINMKVLVTGASGFIGAAICLKLIQAGHEVVASSRVRLERPGTLTVIAPDLKGDTNWDHALHGIEAVVHLAAQSRVDVSLTTSDLEAEYLQINAEGTRSLARQSLHAGVKHFLFMSSVHAVAAQSEEIVTAETVPNPVSAYGRSKWAAEKAVREELGTSDCAWTILRPPAVYGPGKRTHFDALLRLVKAGIPLPLASICNRRSFIYVENLTDVVLACLFKQKSFAKIFLPSDGEDVSTPELIRKIAKNNQSFPFTMLSDSGNNKKCFSLRRLGQSSPRLFPFPERLLNAISRLPALGEIQKLTSSLFVDCETLRRDLGWSPRFSMDEGLWKTI